MNSPPIIDVIIPAFNEQEAIGEVVKDIPKNLVRQIIVVNNNSSDATRERAEKAGAFVVDEPTPGYGRACLRGMRHIAERVKSGGTAMAPDIVVFVDGDHSDYPEHMDKLVEPILSDGMDLVIGSRSLGKREKGSMTTPQVFGNWLATGLIRLFYGVKFTDLGPFRAMPYQSLLALEMRDKTYGWTVEMQVKAVKKKMACTEIPVDYRRRIGFSKISGTVKGTILAGYKIISTIFKYTVK